MRVAVTLCPVMSQIDFVLFFVMVLIVFCSGSL